jgi:hypothetical protein
LQVYLYSVQDIAGKPDSAGELQILDATQGDILLTFAV